MPQKTCKAASQPPLPGLCRVKFPTAESANPYSRLFVSNPGTALRGHSISQAQEAQEVKKLPKASQELPGSGGPSTLSQARHTYRLRWPSCVSTPVSTVTPPTGHSLSYNTLLLPRALFLPFRETSHSLPFGMYDTFSTSAGPSIV